MTKLSNNVEKEVISMLISAKVKLKCKNVAQKEFVKLIKEKEIVIASGPAGVGKSFLSIITALELIKSPESSYKKIKIGVPVVEVDGNNMGYLPGDVKEKLEPYLASSIDIIDGIIGRKNRMAMEAEGILEEEPLSFIRGKSINDTILIMEEAQNMSPSEMKTLLTRIGYGSKFIISGDLDQSDKYRDVKDSGLYDAMLRHKNIDEIGFFSFTENDIVRNPLITKILINYKLPENKTSD